MIDSFKIWEAEGETSKPQIERDLAKKIVLDAADVSPPEGLNDSVKSNRSSLYKILTRGVIKPYQDEVRTFMRNAEETTTLSDLINFIVKISSQTTEPGNEPSPDQEIPPPESI